MSRDTDKYCNNLMGKAFASFKKLHMSAVRYFKFEAELRVCELACKQGTPTINNDVHVYLPDDCFISRKKKEFYSKMKKNLQYFLVN